MGRDRHVRPGTTSSFCLGLALWCLGKKIGVRKCRMGQWEDEAGKKREEGRTVARSDIVLFGSDVSSKLTGTIGPRSQKLNLSFHSSGRQQGKKRKEWGREEPIQVTHHISWRLLWWPWTIQKRLKLVSLMLRVRKIREIFQKTLQIAQFCFVLHEVLSPPTRQPPKCINTSHLHSGGLAQRSVTLTLGAPVSPSCRGCHLPFSLILPSVRHFSILTEFSRENWENSQGMRAAGWNKPSASFSVSTSSDAGCNWPYWALLLRVGKKGLRVGGQNPKVTWSGRSVVKARDCCFQQWDCRRKQYSAVFIYQVHADRSKKEGLKPCG